MSDRSFPSDAATPLQFDDAGHAVLARGDAKARVLDQGLEGDAEVFLELTPRAGIYVHALFASEEAFGPFMHVASDPRNLSGLSFDGKPIDGFATGARFVNTEPDQLLVKWCPTHDPFHAIGDDSTSLHRLHAYLFDADIPDLDLTAEPWELALRRSDGHANRARAGDAQRLPELTHTLQARIADDRAFSGEQAARLLDAVTHFLTLVHARRCAPVCPTATDASGNIAWSRWSSPGSYVPNPPSWYGADDEASLGNLFATFMRKWADPDWRKTLTEVVWWYESASQTSRGIDVGIVLAQIAVELLAERRRADHPDLFPSRRRFKGLSAARRYRYLLGSLGIPEHIPTAATALVAAARTTGWSDGPKAVTRIRNDLVHKGRKLGLSVDAYYDAWKLAVHYLEWALLAMLDYKGNYRSRFDDAIQPVPWHP